MSFNRTPWNAGPGELAGDPENDPALWVQCDCCGRSVPRERIYRIMPAPWNNAPCETWACDECCGREEEGDVPDPGS